MMRVNVMKAASSFASQTPPAITSPQVQITIIPFSQPYLLDDPI